MESAAPETWALADSALPAEAAAYLQAGLEGRRADAIAVVRAALDEGVPPQRIAEHVLVPAQVEIGRRWQVGEASVAQEHQLSDLTHTCLVLLGALRSGASPPEGSPRLVAATVGEEGHALGLRLLADSMEEAGWHVDYLGAGVPTEDLVGHLVRVRPLVLALSATASMHVASAGRLVARLRQEAGCEDLKVLLGGRAVRERPDVVRLVGADGWAATPAEAITVCRAWLPPGTDPVPTPVGDDSSQDDLASRYGFEERHVGGALRLLAEQSGLSVTELRARLGRLPS